MEKFDQHLQLLKEKLELEMEMESAQVLLSDMKILKMPINDGIPDENRKTILTIKRKTRERYKNKM